MGRECHCGAQARGLLLSGIRSVGNCSDEKFEGRPIRTSSPRREDSRRAGSLQQEAEGERSSGSTRAKAQGATEPTFCGRKAAALSEPRMQSDILHIKIQEGYAAPPHWVCRVPQVGRNEWHPHSLGSALLLTLKGVNECLASPRVAPHKDLPPHQQKHIPSVYTGLNREYPSQSRPQ